VRGAFWCPGDGQKCSHKPVARSLVTVAKRARRALQSVADPSRAAELVEKVPKEGSGDQSRNLCLARPAADFLLDDAVSVFRFPIPYRLRIVREELFGTHMRRVSPTRPV
jgi:hypothetical protein